MPTTYHLLKAATFCSLLQRVISLRFTTFSRNAGAFARSSSHNSSPILNSNAFFPNSFSLRAITTPSRGGSLMDMTLPADYPNIAKIKPALSAIRKACRITTLLQPDTSSPEDETHGIIKKDSSPVTIGDFAAQAIVLKILDDAFDGSDIFIAEEDSSNLSAKVGEVDLSSEILHVLEKCGLRYLIPNTEELKRCIDLGQTYGRNGKLLDSIEKLDDPNRDHAGKMRWCLDPIDGTRGFLRGKKEGGQYCVALALIQNGAPIVGILACPNLPVSANDNNYEWGFDETPESNRLTRGCIFVASKNGGCYQLPLFPPDAEGDDCVTGAKRIYVTRNDGEGDVSICNARFCIGVEKYGDPEGKVSAIAKKFHGKLGKDDEILHTRRMDSQVKYGVVARGGAEIITRLPKKSYVEWIWDHAAGRIIIEEAGGCQTDTNGQLVDYGLGAKMDYDVDGLLISCGGLFHETLLDAYRKQEVMRNKNS